ncbi:MAG: outer rane lipoprotein LolB [Gammaproteobacteria bacterium]|jgi:outer membrane lipoprotein LolB|nr:outer rane lipoprotein LolB [Gammaproteobacteria bacterium]
MKIVFRLIFCRAKAYMIKQKRRVMSKFKVSISIKSYWQIFFTSFSFLLLSACTTHPIPSATQALSQKAWRADGVFGYRDQGKGFSAGYIWQNAGDHFTVQIIGPLGAWHANLQQEAGEIILSTSDGKVCRAKDAETLMQENLGWSIPVEYLRYWFIGLPDPKVKSKIIPAQNDQTKQIQQAGWIIDYPSASKILLTQGTKKITVIINHFSA